jgi:predicted TIM-barrel fold metal-dependent hydrolase
MTLFDPEARLDWHAHVFQAGVGVVAGARYAPTESALADDFVANFTSIGLDGGLLIQPSFLGTDNSQMIDAIGRFPDKLKGIAVVESGIGSDELEHLTAAGIIGCRLNLFGKDVPNLMESSWLAFLRRLEKVDWQLELHAPPHYLIRVLPMLEGFAGDVVIDHFGRPDPEKGLDDPNYQEFLSLLNPQQHWVKTSGWYRIAQGSEAGAGRAQLAQRLLEDSGMGERLLWGSDWPHTQHDEISYLQAAEVKSALGS